MHLCSACNRRTANAKDDDDDDDDIKMIIKIILTRTKFIALSSTAKHRSVCSAGSIVGPIATQWDVISTTPVQLTNHQNGITDRDSKGGAAALMVHLPSSYNRQKFAATRQTSQI